MVDESPAPPQPGPDAPPVPTADPTDTAAARSAAADEARRTAVRRRLARRRRLAVASAATVVLIAFVTALATGFGETAAQKVFGDDPAPAATPAPAHGFTIGIAIAYEPGQSFALPEALTDGSRAAPLLLGFADFTQGMNDFLREQGGAPQSKVNVTMTFTGTGERPTRITGLRVAAVQRSAPFAGTAIRTSSGSDHPPINVAVDLDGPTPDVAQSGRPYFGDHQTDVTMSDREPFRVTFTAQRHAYRWVMAVDGIGPEGKLVTSYFGTTGHLVPRPEDVSRSDAFGLTGPATSYTVEYAQAGNGSAFHVVQP